MFLGTAGQGPIGVPQRCQNYTTFKNTFGEDSSTGQLVNYVKLFFANGGTDSYVMRMAKNATFATVNLENENGDQILVLKAQDEGASGESIRAVVSYSPSQPEMGFNLELYRWVADSSGNFSKTDDEIWRGLSMDPKSSSYAPTFLTQNSSLVSAAATGKAVAPVIGAGVSISGLQLTTALVTKLKGTTFTGMQIGVSGKSSVLVALDGPTVAGLTDATSLKNALNTATSGAGVGNVSLSGSGRLVFQPAAGDIVITPAPSNDLAGFLMLGTAQGGIEISGSAALRPAANGIVMKGFDPVPAGFWTSPAVPNVGTLDALAASTQSTLAMIILDPTPAGAGISVDLQNNFPAPNASTPPSVVTTAGTDLVFQDANGGFNGVREKLGIIAQRINAFMPVTPPWNWEAQVWGSRLAILPSMPSDNFVSSQFAVFDPHPPALPTKTQNGWFINNVQTYSVGASGLNSGGFQVNPGSPASDGSAPDLNAYQNAFLIPGGPLDQLDLFNIMVLAPDSDSNTPIESVYASASVFCQQKRCFLVMDPPTSTASNWKDAQTAANLVPALRIGLVKDYSAVFFPRVTINDNGLNTYIGAAGAIAGLFARIDGTRGVWKAPAGTEADIRGIVGVEKAFSNSENGILNPRAINTIRVFSSGIVCWGSRTNYGDDDTPNDYKYVPVRRLAMFMEESLYRGLQWVVFEPNDEPLWAQIRLNVGSFMHDLFRQGAFQGTVPSDAYFVKCDSETTTQSDQNLGIVNIWVGFAPLKPAEFVVLYLQQIAGQIQT